MIRSASALDDRMAPPCTARRRASPCRGTSSSASSPRTSTAVLAKKCAPTIGASAFRGRVRSTTEGMSLLVSVTALFRPRASRRISAQRGLRGYAPQHEGARESSFSHQARASRHATRKALPDLLLRQLAADEDDAALALLAVLPGTLMIAVEDHVHALEHEAVRVVLEREDALAAQDARPLLLHEVLHPGKELVGIERLVGLERDRLHLLVVIMLQAAAMVMMAVTVPVVVVMIVVVVMVVIVMMAAVVEKLRLDFENAVEIEGI